MSQSVLLASVIGVARQAAEIILAIYQDGSFQHSIKADHTPVTSADLAAHQYITERLQFLYPDIPVLSEEAADISLSARQNWSRYWLIDPLDGTQEFIAKSGEFATIIALIVNNQPVLGVVCRPLTEEVYYAELGHGAWKQIRDEPPVPIHCRHFTQAPTQLTLAVSRRQDPSICHQYLSPQLHYDLLPLGSASLKACLVAEGKVDCYLRIGPTGEWDTGATQCIVQEAGGRIFDLALAPLTYNQRETLKNPNFIVVGDAGLRWREILMLAPCS